jgi:hypothetical protein
LAAVIQKAEKRLAQLHDDELANCLKYCFMITGLRAQHYPNEVEKAFLLGYVRMHYGGHTAAEIRLAFDMAIQGKLGIRPEDAHVYDNFSVAYFARIMGAYRSWSAPIARQLEKSEPVPERIPTETEKRYIHLGYMGYLIWIANQRIKPPLKRWP